MEMTSEKTKPGFPDFLLVDSDNKPICVLEAKKECLHPLVAKRPYLSSR